MGRVLPTYLSNWTTDKVRSEHVTVIPGVSVEKSRLSDDGSKVEVLLSDDSEVRFMTYMSIAGGVLYTHHYSSCFYMSIITNV